MFTCILVPLDGSTFAEEALAPARELAQLSSARIVVVRAAPLARSEAPGHAIDPQMQVESLDDADAYLHATVDDLRAAGYEADLVLPVAEPSTGIAAVAEREHADLIILSAHLYGTVGRDVGHSITLHLLDRSSVPVLVWHTASHGADWRPGVPARERSSLAPDDAPILVPLDGTLFAEAAIGPALALARALGQRLILLRAIGPSQALPDAQGVLSGGALGGSTTVSANADLHTRLMDAERYLDALRRQMLTSGVQVSAVAAGGAPFPAIERASRELGVGLVVMATHSQTWLTERLVSSVATLVIEQIPVPTLILRPEGARLRAAPLYPWNAVVESAGRPGV